MKRLLIILIPLVVIVGAVIWYGQMAVYSPASGPSHQTLSSDVYPLFPSVNWRAPVAESVTIGTTTYMGTSVSSSPISAGMDPGGIFTPFDSYYDGKLKALGWHIADDLAAGGHTGGQTGYRKGGDIILVRFGIDYATRPADAPSECPCKVTLSLFSTGS